MIKLHFVLRRKEGMSLEDFQKYWKEIHGPLVAKNAKTLGIKRYLQSHTIAESTIMTQGNPRGEMEAPYDGEAELWWESREAMAVGQTEAGRAASQELFEDEKQFIDFKRSTMWLAEEHVVVG